MSVRIGAHLSIAKGLAEGARLAAEIGGNTFGFHTRNPRGSRARAIGADEVASYRQVAAELALGQPIGHLPYTINLATPKDGIREFGRRVVGEDLRRCDAFGAYAIVLHPGHDTEGDRPAALDRVAAELAGALEAAGPVRTLLLLETMAGQTGEVGGRPEEIGTLLRALGRPAGLGVCLDSCHLFAAGYDLRTRAGIDAMLAELDAAFGLEAVKALHLNDSKFPCGSHRDRHERLGRGELGREGIAAVLRHPFLRELPIIIETPVDDYRQYAGEIAVARELAGDPQA
jgi:deoxyribonuclease-4